MIHNDQELETTKERIAYFQRLLGQLRVTATPEEFPSAASGYRAEIEKMQSEVLDYLTQHSGISEPIPDIFHIFRLHKQLHELYEACRKDGGRFVQCVKRQRNFCREHLDNLIRKETRTTAEEEAALTAKIYMRWELAHLEEMLDNVSAAKDILLTALAEAQETKDEQTIYAAFSRLGQFSLNIGEYDEAVSYFQRAVKYARAHWPHDLTDSLYFLGEAWSYRSQTLPLAVAAFDWICRLHPTPVDALLAKYKCLLLMGETETVKADAAKKSFASCMEAASTVAARLALGRRKRAGVAAAEGLRLAEAEANADWQSHFNYLLP